MKPTTIQSIRSYINEAQRSTAAQKEPASVDGGNSSPANSEFGTAYNSLGFEMHGERNLHTIENPLFSIACKAIKNGDSLEKIKAFIDRLDDLTIVDHRGFTLMHHAAEKNRVDIIRLLIDEYGFDPKSLDNSEEKIPLAVAATCQSIAAMELLLDEGVDIDASNSTGNTAIYCTQAEALSLLIRRGADVNKVNANGETPLYWAAFDGDFDSMKVLLEAGADPNILYEGDKTAFDILKENLADDVPSASFLEFLERLIGNFI